MSKGGGQTRQGTQTLTDPTTAPFKEFGLSEAKKRHESGPMQYYPGQTVVWFSPESEMALGA